MKREMRRGAYPRDVLYKNFDDQKSTIFGEVRRIDWGGKKAVNGNRSEAGISVMR